VEEVCSAPPTGGLHYPKTRHIGLRGTSLCVESCKPYRDVRHPDVRYRDVRYRDVRYRDVRYRDVRYRDVRYRDVRYRDKGSFKMCAIGIMLLLLGALWMCAIGMWAIGKYVKFRVCYRDVGYRTVR